MPYFDDKDSDHNDISNGQQPGSLPFLLEQLSFTPIYQNKMPNLGWNWLDLNPLHFIWNNLKIKTFACLSKLVVSQLLETLNVV